MARRVACLALALLALSAASARGDGDPASDVLLTEDVFLPDPAPSKSDADGLRREVALSFQRGYRVKVAVIGSPNDLGAVTALYGKPASYARFLGTELSLYYIGPLLVVMPAGFGVYDGGRTTATKERVLERLPVPGPGAGALTQSAASAVRLLRTTGALESKDIQAPSVYAEPASGTRGRPLRLRYRVFDDSERSRELVTVTAAAKRLAQLVSRIEPARIDTFDSVTWKAPAKLPKRPLTFCVVAVDPVGNRSIPGCAAIRLR
jgi:hypothetical protein